MLQTHFFNPYFAFLRVEPRSRFVQTGFNAKKYEQYIV